MLSEKRRNGLKMARKIRIPLQSFLSKVAKRRTKILTLCRRR